MQLQATRDVMIELNYFHDFYGGDYDLTHNDMIQLVGVSNDVVSGNITIQNNVFDSGDGAGTQTIFMRNEAAENDSIYAYDNITVDNNLIINSHTNGVFVGLTHNLNITNNSIFKNDNGSGLVNSDAVLSDTSSPPNVWIYDDSTNVTIDGNVVKNVYVRNEDTSYNVPLTDEHTLTNNEYYTRDEFIDNQGHISIGVDFQKLVNKR